MSATSDRLSSPRPGGDPGRVPGRGDGSDAPRGRAEGQGTRPANARPSCRADAEPAPAPGSCEAPADPASAQAAPAPIPPGPAPSGRARRAARHCATPGPRQPPAPRRAAPAANLPPGPGRPAAPGAHPRTSPAPEPRLRIGFVLAPRFTLSAFANFVDVLRLAADDGDGSRPIRCRWAVLSPDMAPVQSSCGVRIEPDERPGDPARFNYVVIVGGLIEGGPGLSPEQAAFLRRAAAARVGLAGLCTGVFALARLGLMDGHRCCVSWFHHQDFLAEFDRMRPVSDRIFVVDRDRLSCSGGVSAAHLAAFLVDRHLGRAAARKSLSIMMIDEPMPGDRPQPGLPLELHARDPLVRRALLAMQQNLHAPLPIARIARDLGVGRRKLERHFNADLGIAPADASLRIRLAQARMLLARTDRTVTRIAEETGFCDASHLIRVFREAEGTTPDLWRQDRAAAEAGPEGGHGPDG